MGIVRVEELVRIDWVWEDFEIEVRIFVGGSLEWSRSLGSPFSIK